MKAPNKYRIFQTKECNGTKTHVRPSRSTWLFFSTNDINEAYTRLTKKQERAAKGYCGGWNCMGNLGAQHKCKAQFEIKEYEAPNKKTR